MSGHPSLSKSPIATPNPQRFVRHPGLGGHVCKGPIVIVMEERRVRGVVLPLSASYVEPLTK